MTSYYSRDARHFCPNDSFIVEAADKGAGPNVGPTIAAVTSYYSSDVCHFRPNDSFIAEAADKGAGPNVGPTIVAEAADRVGLNVSSTIAVEAADVVDPNVSSAIAVEAADKVGPNVNSVTMADLVKAFLKEEETKLFMNKECDRLVSIVLQTMQIATKATGGFDAVYSIFGCSFFDITHKSHMEMANKRLDDIISRVNRENASCIYCSRYSIDRSYDVRSKMTTIEISLDFSPSTEPFERGCRRFIYYRVVRCGMTGKYLFRNCVWSCRRDH